MKIRIVVLALAMFAVAAVAKDGAKPLRIVTLDPGHFHAALVQKSVLENVDSVVHVYAPEGSDLRMHLERIRAYNTRAAAPTTWETRTYAGDDYFERMLAERSGNLVVLSGNNRKKTEYILRSLEAGFNVLADKPMVIDIGGFDALKKAFATARQRQEFLFDVMTERYEITTILQRELSMLPGVFGTLTRGTSEHPAIEMKSVHHFYKSVSGNVLTRPAWFFDAAQQGEGIVDVMTHLVDLVQWEGFPGESLDFTKDISVDDARHWTTPITLGEFTAMTKTTSFPDYLKKDVGGDSLLHVYCNGEIDYRIRGVHARTTALWEYASKDGAGDSHYSVMRGTNASLVIRQGAEQKFLPTLYVEPVGTDASFEKKLEQAIDVLQKEYPGLSIQRSGHGWEVLIPEKYKEGHEEHFARVMKMVVDHYRLGNAPAWEVPNMLAKYYTTTRALELAKQTNRLRPGVYAWDSVKAATIHGSSTPFARVDIRGVTIDPRQGVKNGRIADTMETLIIVKHGTVKVTMNSASKVVGTGSVLLIMPGGSFVLENTGTDQASLYTIKYRSKEHINEARGKASGGSATIDWKDVAFQPHDKGGRRNFFERATAMTKRIEMHVTTLNPEITSHEPHTHAAEEVVLMVDGNAEMQIGDGVYRGASGDLFFLPSNLPHAIRNVGSVPCMYYAIQWE